MIPASRLRFGAFVLDAGNRSLLRDGRPVALNARYFDALVLLVREHGRLVGKQRLFDEVWAGSVVTDAALTQAIKEIRRQLGDDASAPRYVRTVPGHGYCFIADVVDADAGPAASDAATATSMSAGTEGTGGSALAPASRRALGLADGLGATLGGAAAGVLGGLLYGSAIALSPHSQALGAVSVLLVLLALSVLVGMAGAFGVGFGLAAARALGGGPGSMLAGAAFGGFAVGGVVRLLGSDAFTLLVGRAPTGITGAVEGATIGLAVAAGLLLGGRGPRLHPLRPAAFAAATTGLAGALIALAGGSLMATSLARVAATFGDSRLDMAPLGGLFGEPQFGLGLQALLGVLEGAVFGACVVGGIVLVRRWSRGAH